MDNRLNKLVKTLEGKGFKVKTFENSNDVKEELLKVISSDDSVGIGGSMTIDGLGIYEELKQRGNDVYWHWKVEDKKIELEKAKATKVYLSSTNALTEDGLLVNMDGTGNRVSSMIFGHTEVYIVAGKNKICKDYHEAIERINNIAAPKNAIRLNLNTPCKHTGTCNDCSSPQRMCSAEVVLRKNPTGTSINIYIVNEELGY